MGPGRGDAVAGSRSYLSGVLRIRDGSFSGLGFLVFTRLRVQGSGCLVYRVKAAGSNFLRSSPPDSREFVFFMKLSNQLKSLKPIHGPLFLKLQTPTSKPPGGTFKPCKVMGG